MPSKISFHSRSCCSTLTACSLVILPVPMTAFLPSIHGEMKTGRPPEMSLHCLPMVWNVFTAPFVARLISVLMYHPLKLLWWPYIFHTSSMT